MLLYEGQQGYYQGKTDKLLELLFGITEELCKESGLRFEIIITDILSQINAKAVEDEQVKSIEAQILQTKES